MEVIGRWVWVLRLMVMILGVEVIVMGALSGVMDGASDMASCRVLDGASDMTSLTVMLPNEVLGVVFYE